MEYKYSLGEVKENMAKALGRDLPISFKQSIEICNYIRGDSLARAKQKLQDAIAMKKPIPFKRFTNAIGHKRGDLGAGAFPVKASGFILSLLNSAESNALFKGLNSKSLKVSHISVKKAGTAYHYGRKFRRRMKRCHVEVALQEMKEAKKESKDTKEQKVKEKKADKK
jgi:large subunit ribosomal protein L22